MIIPAIDIISTITFTIAVIIALKIKKNYLNLNSMLFLVLFLLIFMLVSVSNLLEHSGISNNFDKYEDYLEILFLPFFIFFIYSVIEKLELDKIKEMEISQKKNEELYRALIDNIELGITLIDSEFNIIMTNKAQGKLFDKSPDTFIGKKCYEEFEKNEKTCSHCPGRRAMDTGKPHTAEATGIKDDGGKLTVKIRAFPFYMQENIPAGFIEVVEDITDLKKMEDELIRTKKLESIGVLAGGIAHDFNNLLTAILGNVSLAKLEINKDEKIYSILEEAENVSLRARDLTQQLLTFSKGGLPVKKTTNVKELIKNSSNFSLSGSNLKSEYFIQDDLWPVEVDEGQISQVINNLITNSKESMPDGGNINIRAKNINLKENEISSLKSGRYIEVSIQDFGYGIPKFNITKIFDPYFTSKKKGSGLGLATAYFIIKNHDGIINVDSEISTGTTFRIYLPASKKEAFIDEKNKNQIIAGKGKVLVMDDEDYVRDIAEKILQKLGYDVDTARDGMEAVEIYRNSFNAGEPHVAVIMDLTIPGGTGGVKALDILKNIDPQVKAIVSSGYANDPVMAHYKEYGFMGVAPKPYKIQDLSIVLNNIITKKN